MLLIPFQEFCEQLLAANQVQRRCVKGEMLPLPETLLVEVSVMFIYTPNTTTLRSYKTYSLFTVHWCFFFLTDPLQEYMP